LHTCSSKLDRNLSKQRKIRSRKQNPEPYLNWFWRKKKFGPFLDLCVSSLRRGHANLLCIVPILSDVPKDELSCSALRYKLIFILITQRCGTSWLPTERVLTTWAGVSLKLGLARVFEIWASNRSYSLTLFFFQIFFFFFLFLFFKKIRDQAYIQWLKL
jgi:hypothetical protein